MKNLYYSYKISTVTMRDRQGYTESKQNTLFKKPCKET